MNDDKGYPRFQYSVFSKNGHDGQYVVRSNDKTEFEQLVKDIKGMVVADEGQTTVLQPLVASPAAQNVDLGTNATCPIHGTPLVWKAGTSKTTGKPYGFWACPTKNADGSYCKGGTKK